MSRSLGFLVALCLAVFAAVFGYYAFERAARVSRSEAAVVAHADEVFRSNTSVVAGNPQGDVSIVAFYDYNCPYCRKDAPELNELVAKDGKVRLVLKELPVLGSDSEDAARIVLAAEKQGRSFQLYRRLIGAQGGSTRRGCLPLPAASASTPRSWSGT
ncbi:MAG: thioredoxin domain-containing protein [Hyphomicrobiales bacterium]